MIRSFRVMGKQSNVVRLSLVSGDGLPWTGCLFAEGRSWGAAGRSISPTIRRSMSTTGTGICRLS